MKWAASAWHYRNDGQIRRSTGVEFGKALVADNGRLVIGVPKAEALLSDQTRITDTGRADPYRLNRPDGVFADGFEGGP